MDITVRYLDLGEGAIRDIFATDDTKWKALAHLGIEKRDNERPLAAWIRWLHELNNLEPQEPANDHITEAIVSDYTAKRFMWWLA